jgi:HK97 family phage portal protein
MNQASWYNAERVQQPGSVILNNWRNQRQNAIKNDNNTQHNLTLSELTRIIGCSDFIGGPIVTEQTAMTVSAVYACVALIAGAIATLPLPIYKRTQEGREKSDHEYWWLLNESPSVDMTAATFWEYMVSANLFYGDAFAELKRASFSSQRVIGLKAHHPNRVTPFRDAKTNRLLYRIQPTVGAQYILDTSDIVHIPGLGFDGLRSCSPIMHAARQAIGTALAAGDYSSSFFSNGAKPDFALKVQGKVSKEQA